ncbi:MAG: hypothetical protein GY938_20740 [Ketobacter sp.]|nr:hypothetical protein [Ketobacter sp.]
MKTVTIYRPTGPSELELVRQSGNKRWPPRLPEQPIFYPVTTEGYAVKIARDWNVKDSGCGFVTRFEVEADYLSQFDVQIAGGKECQEYWIPAEQLEEFNDHIVGEIEVIRAFYPGGEKKLGN